MRILVTGASGFVGTRLTRTLVARGAHQIRCAVRSESPALPSGVETTKIPDISWDTQWTRALEGIDAVVHLAAKVHDLKAQGPDSLSAYRTINAEGTANLARQAAAAGVKRFVFLSSVKVNGEAGEFRETDDPRPADPYGISKLAAETALDDIARSSSMSVTIVRPPLVYGPGVKANFRALLRAVSRRVPLPLGAINNRRSLVALDNLVDFLILCVEHPMAANEVFFVSDGDDVSTTELLRRAAGALGKSARLLPVPPSLLVLAASIIGKRDAVQRLTGTLTVDISKARRLLGWSPPITMIEGLRRAVEGGVR